MNQRPPSIFIRRADVADSAEISDLLHQLGYPTEERCVRDRLGLLFVSHTDAVFVAECDGAVAGFLAFHVIPLFHATGGLGRITALSVGAEFQRRGVGRELVAAAESFGWHSGCLRIEVTSGTRRTGAHAFYQAAGYGEDSRRFVKSAPEAGSWR